MDSLAASPWAVPHLKSGYSITLKSLDSQRAKVYQLVNRRFKGPGRSMPLQHKSISSRSPAVRRENALKGLRVTKGKIGDVCSLLACLTLQRCRPVRRLASALDSSRNGEKGDPQRRVVLAITSYRFIFNVLQGGLEQRAAAERRYGRLTPVAESP